MADSIVFIVGIIVTAGSILGGMYLLFRHTKPAEPTRLHRTLTGNWK